MGQVFAAASTLAVDGDIGRFCRPDALNDGTSALDYLRIQQYVVVYMDNDPLLYDFLLPFHVDDRHTPTKAFLRKMRRTRFR